MFFTNLSPPTLQKGANSRPKRGWNLKTEIFLLIIKKKYIIPEI